MGFLGDVGKLLQQSTASIVGKKLDVKYDTKAGGFLSKVNNTANSIKLAIGAAVLPAVAAKQQDKKVTTTAGSGTQTPTDSATTQNKNMGLFDFFGSGSKVTTQGAGSGASVGNASTGSLDNVSSVFQNLLGGSGGSVVNKNSGVSGNIQFGTGQSSTTTTGTGAQIALMPIILMVGVIILIVWGIKKLLK